MQAGRESTWFRYACTVGIAPRLPRVATQYIWPQEADVAPVVSKPAQSPTETLYCGGRPGPNVGAQAKSKIRTTMTTSCHVQRGSVRFPYRLCFVENRWDR